MNFLLYYSDRCLHCDKLIKTIQNENLIKQCKLICFETHPEKFPDPKIVCNVPTIIAKNVSKPLIGEEAQSWIENKKYFDQITNNLNKNNVLDPKIKSALEDLEYNKSEVVNISDHYTTFNETEILKPKFMSEYDKIDIPMSNSSNNTKLEETKITEEAHKKKLKELIMLRKNQIISRSSCSSKIK